MRSILRLTRSWVALAIVSCGPWAMSPSALAAEQTVTRDDATSMPLGLGGVGGVYLAAEPGELVIEVQKRDRHRGRAVTELRAILAGPDRHVLQEATIPDDGRPAGSGLGPVQRTRLSARVPRSGVYVLNVTVSNDRYGEEAIWGFTTNCPHYVIETARGHKDERHQEPIVLHNPGQPGDVVFQPRPQAFSVEVSGLPPDVSELTMFDAQGSQIATWTAGAKGMFAHTFPAGERRAAPWRLHLPTQQATVQIDGVTRWDSTAPAANLACWTTSVAAWFPLRDYRWVLTPYHRTIYGAPGTPSEVRLRVQNSSDRAQKILFGVEFPGESWPVDISPPQLELSAGRVAELTVSYTAPPSGAQRVCHVRATPAEDRRCSTYSTIEVHAGEAPARRPLTMPLVLRPYQHENEQFGYLPDYPTEYQFYFDSRNRPLAWTDRGIAHYDGHRWLTADLAATVRIGDAELGKEPFRMAATKIVCDRQDRIYALATRGRQPLLLCSTDGGQRWSATLVPGRTGQPSAWDLEQFSGHNLLDGPPPLLRYTRTGEDPKLFWRKLHDLELILPRWEGDRIVMSEPVMLTQKCIGLASHSGIPSSVVSRGDRVHVVWGEATEPSVKVPGVPAYVATYDRQAQRLSTPALVGYGAPPNDIHNSPSITVDSRGHLHVLTGTHGQPFAYARSLAANDASAGWTPAEPVGDGLGQTYIGLVCGPDDVLHAVFRLWQQRQPPFPLSHHATLAYQRKRPDGRWEQPRVLIVPPFSEYSVFYHRLTIDHGGRLWLSYDYWSTFWFYRNDWPSSRRALLVSPDGGDTWKLADREEPR